MKAQSIPGIAAILGLVPLLIFSGILFAAPAGSATEQEFDAVLQVKPDIARGERIFDTCAACHGTKGTGASDGTVPAIAGQHFRVIAWELVNFRHGNRLDPRMQHFTDHQHLGGGAQDIADVSAYVSQLHPSPPRPNTTGNDPARGADLYRHHCSSCHGASAQGSDQHRNPRLAGQHYEYLLSQLQDGSDDHRTNISAHHVQLRQRLKPEDLRAICEYLSGLTSQPAASR